jgi:hypothetical protein
MPPLDDLAREYLVLSFAIERLFPGFIDAYFGPDPIPIPRTCSSAHGNWRTPSSRPT